MVHMANEKLILAEIIENHYLAWIASRILRFYYFCLKKLSFLFQ